MIQVKTRMTWTKNGFEKKNNREEKNIKSEDVGLSAMQKGAKKSCALFVNILEIQRLCSGRTKKYISQCPEWYKICKY